MNENRRSAKHGLITKNNSTMFIALAIAGAVLSFSGVACFTLVKRMNYQSRVIGERVKAEKQLEENIENVTKLIESYKNFDEAAESVIGNSSRNSKVVLDALPSKYDFPALATSLEKLLVDGGFNNIVITGSDNEASAEQNSTTPKAIEIPFSISATGPYDSLQQLVTKLQLSIRPFKILTFDITAESPTTGVNFTISGLTYYQPEKNLEIPLKEVE